MAHVLLYSTKSYGVILSSFIFEQTVMLISFWNWCTPSWSNLDREGGGADAVVIKRFA